MLHEKGDPDREGWFVKYALNEGSLWDKGVGADQRDCIMDSGLWDTFVSGLGVIEINFHLNNYLRRIFI